MGFRKALYDVEEKSLDPTKPHKEVGTDGRLRTLDSHQFIETNQVTSENREVKEELLNQTNISNVENVELSAPEAEQSTKIIDNNSKNESKKQTTSVTKTKTKSDVNVAAAKKQKKKREGA